MKFCPRPAIIYIEGFVARLPERHPTNAGVGTLVILDAPVGPQSSREAIRSWLKRLYDIELRYRHDAVARELVRQEIARVQAWLDDVDAPREPAPGTPPGVRNARHAGPTPLPATLDGVHGIGYATWSESHDDGFTGSFYTAMRDGTRLFRLAGGRSAVFRGPVHTGADPHRGWLYVTVTRIEVRGRNLFVRFRSTA
ncbi:MAG TPA: hypothetical protein VJ957_07200 [Longimicrobiales bacterium]|nr:hypothetical protein [Longimicrobiales bacterium]